MIYRNSVCLPEISKQILLQLAAGQSPLSSMMNEEEGLETRFAPRATDDIATHVEEGRS